MTPINPGRNLHFIGITGTGMNAVAQLALQRGKRVSGSDRALDQGCITGSVAAGLTALGARLTPQDGSGIDSATDTVVVSTAIEPDNPDLVAAHARGLRVLHRAAALAELLGDGNLIGVAGTSGKSTVTGMLGWVLTALGMDPTVVNGAALLNWRQADRIGNVRVGASPWQVVELDESDRSLLRFSPAWAIITNISADHFNPDETLQIFRQFRTQVKCGAVGALDPEPVPDAAHPLPNDTDATRFVCEGHPVHLRLPGSHNVANARQCLALCRRLGCNPRHAAEALSGFDGLERRLERVSNPGGLIIYDDVAHNPAKIAAAMAAVRRTDGRLLAVWQPHGFRPLRQMFDDLAVVFSTHLRSEDRLLLLPVYYSGGTAQRSVTSVDLALAVRRLGADAIVIPDWPALTTALSQSAPRRGDVILCMGARDPGFPRQVSELAATLGSRL